MTPKINVLLGTKAEMIKVAPVLKELEKRGVPFRLIETGQHGAYLNDLRKELKNDLVSNYESLYRAFEESVINSEDFKKNWKGPWVSEFIKVGIENVTPPYVTIGGMLSLTSEKEDGVEGIKTSLMGPKALHEDSKLTISSDGAPNYRVRVKAPNYKQAEEELKSAVDLVLSILKKEGGVGSFERV